jgi:hypothetical protein
VKTNKRTAVKARRRTVKPVVDPEVFEEAARLIGEYEQEFACNALRWLQRDEGASPVNKDYFIAILQPHDAWCCWYVLAEEARLYNQGDLATLDRVRHARVIGLLLCAELAREGFIPPGFEPEKGAGQ